MGATHKRSRRAAFFAVICLLLAVGSVYEWQRSQASFDTLRWGGFVAMAAEGKLCLLHTDAAPSGPDRSGFHSVPYNTSKKDAVIVQWPNFGHTWTTDPRTGETKFTLVAPLWFVAMLFTFPTVWWFLRGRHSARLADEMD